MVNRLLGIFVLIVLFGVFGVTSGASDIYAVTVDDSIDTPSRTVTVDGNTHTVSEISNINTGDTIVATVTAPDSDSYRVQVYGVKDESWVKMDSKYIDSSEDDTISFDTNGYWLGSYVLAVSHNGTIQAIHPIIVSQCSVDVSTNSEVEKGGTISVNTSITQVSENTDIERVKIVAMNESVSRTAKATRVSDTVYNAQIDVGDWSAGSYKIYAMVQNSSKTPNGEYEPIGISSPTTFEIVSQDQTTTEEDSGGGGTSGTTSTLTSTTKTTTSSTTTNSTTEGNNTTTDPLPTTNTSTLSTTTSGSTSTTFSTKTSSTVDTTSQAITPNTTTSSSTTSTTVPGFHLLIGVIAFLATASLLYRR